MSHKHCGDFVRLTEGIPWETWINKYVNNSDRSGSGIIKGVRSNGTESDINISDAVLILKNLQDFQGSEQTNLGFTSEKIGLVTHIKDAYECIGCNKYHKYLTQKDGFVPLFLANKESGTISVQQCARWCLSKGRNNINMSDGYVGSMYIRSIQNLIFAISNEISLKKLGERFDVLLHLVKSAFHYANSHSDTMKVFDASARDANLQDTLERVVALMLTPSKEFDVETVFRCLEVSLKRAFKRNKWVETKLISNSSLLCGIVSIILIAPMIKRFITNNIEISDVIEEYNNKTEGLLKILIDNKCTSVDLLSYFIVDIAGFSNIKKSNIEKFYKFCQMSQNYSNNADFERFNFVKKTILSFPFRKSEIIKTKSINENEIFVECVSANHWGVLELSKFGEYRLSNFKTIGVATQSVGNTQGQSFNSNFRITSNSSLECMPKYTEGKSSAGMHYKRNKYGKWNYETSNTLDMTLPLTISFNNNILIVKQNDVEWFKLTTTDPVVIAFKNYEFHIEKQIVKYISYAAAAGGGASKEEPNVEINSDDVCNMALAKYISKLNAKKSK